jgi:hypothetical protein
VGPGPVDLALDWAVNESSTAGGLSQKVEMQARVYRMGCFRLPYTPRLGVIWGMSDDIKKPVIGEV